MIVISVLSSSVIGPRFASSFMSYQIDMPRIIVDLLGTKRDHGGVPHRDAPDRPPSPMHRLQSRTADAGRSIAHNGRSMVVVGGAAAAVAIGDD